MRQWVIDQCDGAIAGCYLARGSTRGWCYFAEHKYKRCFAVHCGVSVRASYVAYLPSSVENDQLHWRASGDCVGWGGIQLDFVHARKPRKILTIGTLMHQRVFPAM